MGGLGFGLAAWSAYGGKHCMLLLCVAVASDAAAFRDRVFLRIAAMTRCQTTEKDMKPQTTIELESCSLVQLVMLFCVIEAERWVDRVSHREQMTGFANQEKLRRAIAERARPPVYAEWR